MQKCSICGFDLHLYNGRQLGPLDYSQVKMNVCVGHETISEVVEVGGAVTKHRVGDRILMAGVLDPDRDRRLPHRFPATAAVERRAARVVPPG